MLQEEKEIENEILTRSEKSQRSKDSHTWTDDKTETFTESGNKRKKNTEREEESGKNLGVNVTLDG